MRAKPCCWILALVVLVLCVGIVRAIYLGRSSADKIRSDVKEIGLAMAQYRSVIGRYPQGNNVEISRALLEQNSNTNTFVKYRPRNMSRSGEALDPWGTPYRFYFSSRAEDGSFHIMIQSAGANRVFGDDDDYFDSF